MRYLTAVLLFSTIQLFSQSEGKDIDWKSVYNYRNVGPSRGGRVTTVTGERQNPGHFYMGATGGGLWKSFDHGSTWDNISDGYFETGSIGSIALFQADPSILYVGTGSDGIRSNVILGKGVYKSVDSGKKWISAGLQETGQIGAVVIHPSNPDIVWVAAIGNPFGPGEERGVYKTTDGGKSWKKVLYLGESTGVCDLELSPADPEIVYASAWSVERKPWTINSGSHKDGVYKSIDGGTTWSKLGGGLPEGLVGKSDLAVTPARPEMLYVLIEAPDNKGGLYISSDYGKSFKWCGWQSYLIERPFYYTNVDVDPTNPDIIWVNCTGLYKSTDRGLSWKRQSTPHGDNHDIWINPDNTDILIQANDGGANVSRDGGKTWSSQENQLTAELYQVDLDDQFPYWLYAGQQDNTTIAVPSRTTYPMPGGPTAYWLEIGGCETGPAVPQPGNHNIVYANCKGRFGRYNKLTGQEKQYSVGASNLYGHNPADLEYRFQRVSPIIVSSHNPGIVYHASQYLHKTEDEGVTWKTISPDLTAFSPEGQVISGGPITRDITGEEYYSTVYSVAESPLVAGVIWTGANDGPVFVTRNGGAEWANVTPKEIAGGGRVQTVEASPHNPAKAFVAVYRYLLNDWKPYILMTRDFGLTWSLLTSGYNGIPANEPVRVVREDTEKEGLLFAGTEKGIYISFDEGVQWHSFSQNFPVVPVTDMKIIRNEIAISTMGRSFWILDNIASLRQFVPGKTIKSMLMTPPVTTSYRSEARAEIDYFLSESADSAVLTISSSSGIVVWRVSSNKASGRGNALKLEPGINRYVWDMKTFGPSPASSRRSSGPVVPPGKYDIALEIGLQRYTASLEIVPDPVITDDGVTIADMEAQYNLACEVRDLLVRSRELESLINQEIDAITSRSKRAKKLSGADERAVAKYSILLSAIATAEGPYPQPMLTDQIAYLYYMVNGSAQKPGNDMRKRYADLKVKVLEYEAEAAVFSKK